MFFRFINLLAILAIFLVYSTANGQVSVDPVGFAVAIEQGEELETEIVLHNFTEEAVPYNVRIRKMNREEERQNGPRRDDPGETLAELELSYSYTVGLAWDAENEIMYAAHCVDARITGYQWNGEEIVDVPVDFVAQNIPGSSLVALALFENVFYTFYWGQSIIYRYDIEGNQLENINTQWNDGLTYGLGLAVDPENAHLYMSAFHNAGEHSDIKIYDINDNYAEIGWIDGIENMGEARDADVRNRLNWVPEHEDGHLWVYERNYAAGDGAAGPYCPPYDAWQLDIIPGEEGVWGYEVITHFEVESDAWSNGICHDGENLWIGNRDSNIARIVDDGLSEAKWVTIEPRSGEVPPDEDVVLSVVIMPVELEDGVYEQVIRIGCADPAQTVIEMSVVMSLATPTANVSGTVTDAATGEAVEGVRGDMDYYFMSRWTDVNGGYGIENLPMGEYVMTFTHPDYLPSIAEVVIDEAGEVVVDVEMLHGEFNPDVNAFRESLAPDTDMHVAFNVSNDGNAPVQYTSDRRLIGDANTDPWELRRSYAASAAVNDARLEGVVFIDDIFYVSGHGDVPTIYVLNREGEQTGTIQQPGADVGYMRDLAWDGELIWGAVAREVYGFTTDGEEVIHFEGPYNPTSSIAWDPNRELLWMGATTSDPASYNRNGERLETLDRLGLRIYGMAYWPADPDGFGLYIFNSPGDDRQVVHKMNPDNGDTMFVRELFPEAGGRPAGAFITNQFDVYSWVFVDLVNDGGDDRIDVWQLDVRKDWFLIDPTEGVIEANENQEFDLHLDATGLPVADFEGEIVFNHNGFGNQITIPVSLSVVGGRVPADRTLQLEFGWNMVSVNIQPDEADVRILTRPLVDAEVLEIMKNGAGQFYSPRFGFNNIPGWAVEQGYLMKVTEDAELVLDGITVLPDDPIQLRQGWQMVSYFPRVPVDAIFALSGIVDQLLLAKDGDGRFYSPPFGFSNMGDLREGSGYLFKVSEDVELVYSFEEEQLANSSNSRLVASRLGVVAPTGENMSLLVLGDGYLDSDVGVYADGMLVGSGRFTDGACGIAIWGDDLTTDKIDGALPDQPLELLVLDDSGAMVAGYTTLTGESTYKADGFWAVQINDSQLPSQFGLSEIYPNPFNAVMNLRFDIPNAAHVSIAIYDVSGRLVEQLVNDEWTAGQHKLVWDASSISTGVYLLRMEAPGFSAVRKALLVK